MSYVEDCAGWAPFSLLMLRRRHRYKIDLLKYSAAERWLRYIQDVAVATVPILKRMLKIRIHTDRWH